MVENVFHILEPNTPPSLVLCPLLPFLTERLSLLIASWFQDFSNTQFVLFHLCAFSMLSLPCTTTAFLCTSMLQILSQKPSPL